MKPKRLELTTDELAKISQRKRRDEKIKVSPEELFIAEFGYYYGWNGMLAILNNEITMDDANILLTGARKVWNAHMIDTASIMFTASAAAQSGKKAKQVMSKGLKDFIKQAKADV